MEIDVRHIAKLAMLRLSGDEAAAMEREFSAFIAMAQRLPETENADMLLEPEAGAGLREDTVVPSYPREALLQNAPRTAAGCILVPGSFGVF